MRNIQLRYLLPVANLPVAIALTFLSDAELRGYLKANHAIMVSDYIPLAAQVAYSINFPAFLVTSAFAGINFFETIFERTIFFGSVAVLWFLVGLGSDCMKEAVFVRNAWHTTKQVLFAILAVLLACIAIFGFALAKRFPVVGVGGLLWSFSAFTWFLLAARRKSREKTVQP